MMRDWKSRSFAVKTNLKKLSYVLISPARNEETFIEKNNLVIVKDLTPK